MTRLPFKALFFFLNMSAALAAPATTIAPSDLHAILAPLLGQGMRFGVDIEAAGAARYSEAAQQTFTPASLTKLFTAGLALERLGPNHAFKTRVEWKAVEGEEDAAADLTLIGDGDPTWGMHEYGEGTKTRVTALAARLKAARVRVVYGPILTRAEDPRLDAIAYPRGWGNPDLEQCSDSPVPQAFNLAANCARLRFTSCSQARWLSPNVATSFRLSVHNGKRDALRAHFEKTDENPHHDVLLIEGTLASCAGVIHEFPVRLTADWARAIFQRALADTGIRVVDAPAGLPVSKRTNAIEYVSKPLSEILRPMLKLSLNFVAEALLRKVGELQSRSEQSGSPSLVDAGREAMTEFLREPGAGEIGSAAHFEDGSGLSHENEITPAAMVRYLAALRERPDFQVIWNALPIAGYDGTLASRMFGSARRVGVRAKTGTLRRIHNLAGYIPVRDGTSPRYVPFAIFAEGNNKLGQAAMNTADQLTNHLVDAVWTKPQRAAHPSSRLP